MEGELPARRGSVLVVDDEPLVLKVVAALLREEHDVSLEPSARAALERFQRGERFDAVLCDLTMPEMGGIELYEGVCQIAPEQLRKFLFLTGGAFTARARAFLDDLPGATVEKPFDRLTLLGRVRSVVNR